MDEETADFRRTPVNQWQIDASMVRGYDNIKENKRYTRVIDVPDGYIFYDFVTEYFEKAMTQVAYRTSRTQGEITPLKVVFGGVVKTQIDSSILLVEHKNKSIIGNSNSRYYISVLRDPSESIEWEGYVEWAIQPENWTPNVTTLNYTGETVNAAKRLRLSSPLGDSRFVLQCKYGCQVFRKDGKTFVTCCVVPECSTGLMSVSWYLGLREAYICAREIAKSLKGNAPAMKTKDNKNIIRYHEPLEDRLNVI